MELRNIKSFIKVAEFENFSKAAEVLGIMHNPPSPCKFSSWSRNWVSICLTASGKRVLLSEKGRAFLSYANDMVQLEAEAIETSFRKYHPYRHPAHRHD